MLRLLVSWLLSAILLLVVAHFVPGFHVSGFQSALIAAVVIGLINATVGTVLKILTFPLSILTLGIFILIINAMMLMLASNLVPGFSVSGFRAAFTGAILLALLHMLIRWLTPRRAED